MIVFGVRGALQQRLAHVHDGGQLHRQRPELGREDDVELVVWAGHLEQLLVVPERRGYQAGDTGQAGRLGQRRPAVHGELGVGRADARWPTAGPVTYGPAHSVNSYGFIETTVANRHTPAAPSAGLCSASPFEMQVQPAGSVTISVIAARRSGWSKQQNTLGAAVGKQLAST